MTEETLILGVQRSDLPFGYGLPPLYWDKGRGNNGYHSISWEKTATGFEVKSKTDVWGTAHEAQAGVVLSEIIERSPESWFWAKDPLALFPGAFGFYMKKELADKLREASKEDPFSGIKVVEELYNPKVILGFATLDEVKVRVPLWYDTLEASTDQLLKDYLTGFAREEVKEMTEWLIYVSLAIGKQDQANLRYLLTHPMDGETLERFCFFADLAHDVPVLQADVLRREGTEVNMSNEGIFSSPDRAKRALRELRERLIE
ncbi:MAG: hypothetical protein WCV90_01505 [Candidatus Woesearchaeota archaeon]